MLRRAAPATAVSTDRPTDVSCERASLDLALRVFTRHGETIFYQFRLGGMVCGMEWAGGRRWPLGRVLESPSRLCVTCDVRRDGADGAVADGDAAPIDRTIRKHKYTHRIITNQLGSGGNGAVECGGMQILQPHRPRATAQRQRIMLRRRWPWPCDGSRKRWSPALGTRGRRLLPGRSPRTRPRRRPRARRPPC